MKGTKIKADIRYGIPRFMTEPLFDSIPPTAREIRYDKSSLWGIIVDLFIGITFILLGTPIILLLLAIF